MRIERRCLPRSRPRCPSRPRPHGHGPQHHHRGPAGHHGLHAAGGSRETAERGEKAAAAAAVVAARPGLGARHTGEAVPATRPTGGGWRGGMRVGDTTNWVQAQAGERRREIGRADPEWSLPALELGTGEEEVGEAGPRWAPNRRAIPRWHLGGHLQPKRRSRGSRLKTWPRLSPVALLFTHVHTHLEGEERGPGAGLTEPPFPE